MRQGITNAPLHEVLTEPNTIYVLRELNGNKKTMKELENPNFAKTSIYRCVKRLQELGLIKIVEYTFKNRVPIYTGLLNELKITYIINGKVKTVDLLNLVSE